MSLISSGAAKNVELDFESALIYFHLLPGKQAYMLSQNTRSNVASVKAKEMKARIVLANVIGANADSEDIATPILPAARQ